MASGTKNKSGGKSGGSRGKSGSVKAARSAAAVKKPKPWGAVAIVVALVALAGVVFGYAYIKIDEATAWKPSDSNRDPSSEIAGVTKIDYKPAQHVTAAQRVAYDHSPPFGGPHDQTWASCEGIVYATPVRTENMVHMLEHGAIWVTYNPDLVKGGDLDVLKGKVSGQDFISMSPYPGLDKPFSLQSWGHQLKLDNVNDERVDQFIQSLKRNEYQYPEPGARCDASAEFDPNNPPPFDPAPPPADAVKMDGTGSQQGQVNNGQEAPPAAPPAPGTQAPSAPAPGSQQPSP
jgi:hypothetical protein